jgi:aquaglyceroporin related protein
MADNDRRLHPNPRETQSTNSQFDTRSCKRQQVPHTRRTSKENARVPRPNQPNPLPKRPQYSLAGNTSQAHGPSYVDPRYYELNPRYRQLENAPVWGLAKPLPRVVRPGMKRGLPDGQRAVEDKGAQREEPGSAEAIPQLGMIYDQRDDVGKNNNGERKDVEGRGYGHEGLGRRQSERRPPIAQIGSENSVVDRFGTPKDERGNPMEEWQCRGASYKSRIDPFDDQNADLGERRLSTLQEVSSSPDIVAAPRDENEIDLEAGEKSEDWSLDKQDAEHYAQVAADGHNTWCTIRAKFREPLAECLAVSAFLKLGVLRELTHN